MVDLVEQIGAFAGLAAFLGLAVLALLSFTHGRDIRRLRDWAGSAPERDAERKEATSAIAAQRAEELRALEGRTAEHEAVSRREERRRRREAGLPEAGRGERMREALSSVGERLAQPRFLIALFVVMLIVVGGVAYAVIANSDESASGKNGRHAAASIKPGEIEVAVLNGTAVPELAANYGDKVERKGFKVGAITNTNSSFEESVVMFMLGHKPEANKVAKSLRISKVKLMSSEVEQVSEGANVAVIAGEDNAAAAG